MAENDPQWQIWPKKWLRLGQNGHFCIFFYLFPQNEAEIDSEWSISPDSQLFPSFATKVSYFWRNLKNFHFQEGYIGKFFEFSNFFKSFHTHATENDPQWQIWPKEWLRLGQNGQFCIMRLILTWNHQLHVIHNFSHLLPPKHLIFGEISKIFIFKGKGGISTIFVSFPTF